MKKVFATLLVSLMALGVRAQEQFPQYPSPVDIPIYLSATFAELRNNSFHAGIDIKTQGVEGKNVFAVADGYVSRIGVSPYGYGNVVYITHDDGFTSVYAHLLRFNQEIARYVAAYQYRNRTFAASIYLSRETFPIHAGDFIGLSGNTGGSGGPHLHFEIRHTASEKPVNPLYFGLNIADNVKPNIKGIAVYPVDETSTVEGRNDPKYYQAEGSGTSYHLPGQAVVHANGHLAFGINTDDQVGTSPNKNGPYVYELFVDNLLSFRMECDSFSYSEPRYVNSLIDYRRFKEVGNRFVRTEVDPFNRLSMIERRRGVVEVKEGDTLNVSFRITDFAGNTSAASFQVIGTAPVEVTPPQRSRSDYFVKADGSLNNRIEIENFQVILERGTFFRDEWMKTGVTNPRGCCSSRYQFGEATQAVFKAFKVRIKPEERWANDPRLFIAYFDGSDRVSSLGGHMCGDGYMEADSKLLGRYALKIDSVAPVVRIQNFRENDTLTSSSVLRVTITDDMTGISHYDMYANDTWILGKYDAKNNLLYHEMDGHIRQGNNRIKVVVKDAVGNTTTKNVNVYMR